MTRDEYIDSLGIEDARSLLKTIMTDCFEPLGTDADIQYWDDEDSTPGFYCSHSGEPLLEGNPEA